MLKVSGLFATLLTFFFVVHGAQASAVELKALATVAMEVALTDLKPKFEAASGDKLSLGLGLGAVINKRILEDEQADIIISTREGVDNLIKAGKVIAGSDVVIARGLISLGVKRGVPKPDISTQDALIKTLTETKAISYSNPQEGGASGVYFAKIIDKLGLAESLKSKTKFASTGGTPGQLLVSQDVDIAIHMKSELMAVDGVEVVGPLPGEFQKVLVVVAAIPSTCSNPAEAKKLISFLQSPDALSVMSARGMESP